LGYFLALVLIVAGVGGTAPAATKTFDGGASGTGVAWNTATNWVGDSLPTTSDEILIDNSVLATLPNPFTTQSLTVGAVIFDTNNTTGVAVNESGTTNRTMTLSGGGGSSAAIAAGGATGDLIVLGTNATTNTVTVGGNLGAGTGGLILKFAATGNINVVNSGATLVLNLNSFGTDNNCTGLTKTGNGTLVLESSSTELGNYAAFTGLTITAGTLKLGAANRIATKPILLAGGTLHTGGFNETVGTLQLLNHSVIDLGAGASVLNFSASSGVSWTSGKILEILNWSGAQAGGGTDQLKIGSNDTGLTADQLSQIRFVNPTGLDSGTYFASQLSTGEVVPGALIPEPASVGLLGLGAVGCLVRRSRRK